MIPQKVAIELSRNFIADLQKLGYDPTEAYIFGADIEENDAQYENINLALWDDKFTVAGKSKLSEFKYLIVSNTYLVIHVFNKLDSEEQDPFARLVRRKGLKIL